MLQHISRNRASLMAFAILGVLFSHTNSDYGLFVLNRLCTIGYGGVDIFFFLSGFGLYFSQSKNSAALPFYRKRFARLYPAFFVVLVLWLTINKQWSVGYFLELASTIGYWFPSSCGWHYMAWFVSAIILLYLIFPPYFRLFRRHPLASTVVACLTGFVLSGIYTYVFLTYYPPGQYNGYILFTARIPVFFVGVLFGWLAQREAEGTFCASRGMKWLLAALFVAGLAAINLGFAFLNYGQLRNTALLFYPFLLMTPAFCISMGWLLSRLPRWCRTLLSTVGGVTLEAYMLMSLLYSHQPWFVSLCGGNSVMGGLLLVVTTLLFAYVLHQLLHPVTKVLAGKSKP